MQNTDEMRKAFISLGLCHMLNCLGYSPQMINLRKKLQRNMEYIIQHANKLCLPKVVGSKAEGGSCARESDYDLLLFFTYAVCVEASVLKYTGSLSNLNSIYTMVPCLYHPGHFKLLLMREGLLNVSLLMSTQLSKSISVLTPIFIYNVNTQTQILHPCLKPSDSGKWLSSKELLKQIKDKYKTETITTAGPSFCIKSRPNDADRDNTLTIPCFCPTILGKWIQRYRKYNWPPSEVIQQISQMSGNLVPTGIKGCYAEEIEWRLCFNEIELLLVENWNETETKLYVFLKMIKKDVFKLDHEISSYMIKNIVFWLSERYPQTDFRPENLFSWVMKALWLLKRAVKEFLLPYYMIPERNLIAEKLPKYRKRDAIRQINNAIGLGPQLLWGCKKIEMAMSMSLPELQLYQQKRDELEWLDILAMQNMQLEGLPKSNCEKTDYMIALEMRTKELMNSPWPAVILKQLSECSTWDDLLMLLLK